MIECKNCGTQFQGDYCPNCGQKVIERRMNMKDSLAWFFNSIFNLDRGFFFTTMQLITNPRLVIKDVLGGVTIKYVHPFRLLFIWATISTLLIVIFGTYDAQTSDMYETFGFSEEQIETQQRVNEVLKKYLSFIIMLNVPAIAFFSWLFYSKHKLNYTEHLVINSYAMALTTALGILVVFAQYFLDHPGVFMWISLISNIVIVGYVYSAFFKENYIVSFFKFLAGFILAYVGMIFLSMVGFIIYSIITG